METSFGNQNSFTSGTFLDSKYLDPNYLSNNGSDFIKSFLSFITSDQAIIFYKMTLFFLAFFFLTIICYVIVRMFEIRKKEHNHLHHEIYEYAHHKKERERKMRETSDVSKNERWIKTLGYLFSQHNSDWKLAIIEADSMLEDLMNQMGFKGQSLGEKLKSATQESFHNLSIAWEVHTVRNRIAHESSAFELSQHEAKRLIALYEQIFRGYGYI